MKQKIELNKQFRQALDLMENTNCHLFVTGKAGTGKSTLLEYFRDITKKNVAILAPTGVAAVNIRGQTIHSFFGFKPDITVDMIKKRYKNRKRKGLYKKLDAIVIDEISMVRADLLDCVDQFLRLNGPNKNLPFGNIQMIFIGDLYQLPPVVTREEQKLFLNYYESPYFFDAKVFDKLDLSLVQLEKIYRQKDEHFIKLLNAVRNRSVTKKDLLLLNSRFHPNFEPLDDDFFIYLTTTNRSAYAVNELRLNKLSSKLLVYQGIVKGHFDDKALPAPINLRIKTGAQIMLVNNDRQGRWINGTIGKVLSVDHDDMEETDIIVVELTSGEVVNVNPHTWEMFRFFFNQKTGKLDSETIGSFTQYPIILAWAVTIHKSQGKTFDKVIIDLGKGTFAHGQSYVALSRCTSLQGLVLKKPFLKKHILMDWRVVKFLTGFQYQLANKRLSLDDKMRLIKQAIEKKESIKIVYLKTNDEKSKRIIQPEVVGEMEYLGKTYLGMEGYCFLRQDTRVFRVDRILDMEIVKE